MADRRDARQRLRARLASGPIILAPGIYDACGARLAEQAGFEAVYLTGNGVSASLLGRPDVGLVDLTLLAAHDGRVAAATRLPVVCDADTGYGNAVNVRRTVEEFEAAGVAAIHLEDQVAPKRCGHLRRDRHTRAARGRMLGFEEYNRALGLDEVEAWERRFLPPA